MGNYMDEADEIDREEDESGKDENGEEVSETEEGRFFDLQALCAGAK
jgi:hypothetical protein